MVRSGILTKITSAGFGQSYAQFYLLLHNSSPHLAALDIQITETFLGKGAGPSLSSSQSLTGIPPGGNFYFGGNDLYTPKPTGMRVTIKVARTSSAHFLLPRVTKTAIVDPLLPHAAVTIEEPYSQQSLDNYAGYGTIYVIYFGNHGQFVGVGQSIQFLIGLTNLSGGSQTYNATAGAPVHTVHVQASVDPCATFDTSCIALQ